MKEKIINILDKYLKLRQYFFTKFNNELYNEKKYKIQQNKIYELDSKNTELSVQLKDAVNKYNYLVKSHEDLENDLNDWVIKYNEEEKKLVELEYENIKLKKEIINIMKESHISDSSFSNQ